MLAFKELLWLNGTEQIPYNYRNLSFGRSSVEFALRTMAKGIEEIGSPKRISSTAAYCAAKGFEWQELYPVQEMTRQPPICVNYEVSNMLSMVATELPACGIAVLPKARIVSPEGWIIGADDTFLPDHSWFGAAPSECPFVNSSQIKPERRLDGTTLFLCSDWAYANYGHTLLDALSRTHLFELSAKYSWLDLSWIVVPPLLTVGKRRLAEIAGIPFEKICSITDFALAECETLIAPTFPGLRRNTPAWVSRYWRSKIVREGSKPSRRIYITRRNASRAILNEEELLPVLRRFGFEIIDPEATAIFPLFQEAEIVAGAHGAALADVVFCRPNAILLEFTSPLHIYPYFYTAAEAARMQYYSILGSVTSEGRNNPTRANFTVLVSILLETLTSIEESLNQRHMH